MHLNEGVFMRRSVSLFIAVSAILIVCVASATACGGYRALEFDPTSDYGLYWYGDGASDADVVRASEGTDVEYFDPSKPTVLYFHGWKSGSSNDRVTKVEDLRTPANSGYTAEEFDVVEYYKRQGYNVGAMSWYRGASSLNQLFGYIWSDLVWDGASQGKSLAYAFASELAHVFRDYEGEITFVGHSYGTQAAVAVNYLLAKYADADRLPGRAVVASRMSLADPYIGDLAVSDQDLTKRICGVDEKLNGRKPAQLFADCVNYLATRHNVVTDVYCGMPLAYDQYADKDKIFPQLTANTAWVVLEALQDKHGKVGEIHNITRDFMLLSARYDLGDVPSMHASNQTIRACMGKQYVLASGDLHSVGTARIVEA